MARIKVFDYKQLYEENERFRDYVDRFQESRKDLKLEEILQLKVIRCVGDAYINNEI